MLALGNTIKDRLATVPALTGWFVRKGTANVDRKPLPSADVRFGDAQSIPTRNTAAQLSPQWVITLSIKASDDAEEMLDAAIAGVIKHLHNWAPGQVGGRGWEPLRVTGVVAADFPPDGVLAFELSFASQALYDGQG